MSQTVVAILFPFVGVAAVGLTALFIVKPWKKRKPKSEPDVRVGDMVDTGADRAILDALNAAHGSDLVLSPQARHRLHEEMEEDLAQADRIFKRILARERRLRTVDDLAQTSNGGNF